MRATPCASLCSAEASAIGTPEISAPARSAAYSRVRLIAIWTSIAAKGATITAAISAIGLGRSEEHTSELQSLMRISYAVFCLKKNKKKKKTTEHNETNTTTSYI